MKLVFLNEWPFLSFQLLKLAILSDIPFLIILGWHLLLSLNLVKELRRWWCWAIWWRGDTYMLLGLLIYGHGVFYLDVMSRNIRLLQNIQII